MEAEGKRFKKALLGYNKTLVDVELDRLLEQVDRMMEEQEQLKGQINTLSAEKTAVIGERDKLSVNVATMGAQVVQLEQNLSNAQSTADNLRLTIDAQAAEKNAMQQTVDQLRVRDREYAMREREFTELQSSVSSIMSVTKRATDRLFQRAVDNQENVTRIAGEAAKEVATIRADMASVRTELNKVLDDLQDRIDRMDATLTGAVHKLVAIKHDNGLQPGSGSSDINAEVERLLSMRAGEVDYAGGKGYAVPVLGPFSAKFLADTSKAVSENAPVIPAAPEQTDDTEAKLPGTIEVRKANPSVFESSKRSIKEANRLLDNGGAELAPVPAHPATVAPVEERRSKPIKIGFTADDDDFTTSDSLSFEPVEKVTATIGDNQASVWTGDTVAATATFTSHSGLQMGMAQSSVEYDEAPAVRGSKVVEVAIRRRKAGAKARSKVTAYSKKHSKK